jgi:hypothetical protein
LHELLKDGEVRLPREPLIDEAIATCDFDIIDVPGRQIALARVLGQVLAHMRGIETGFLGHEPLRQVAARSHLPTPAHCLAIGATRIDEIHVDEAWAGVHGEHRKAQLLRHDLLLNRKKSLSYRLNYQLNKSQNFFMNSANKKTRRPSEPKTVHLPAHGRSMGGLSDQGSPMSGRRVKRRLGNHVRQLHSLRARLSPVVH